MLNIPSPPSMNPIFQPVQETDTTTSNKETPTSLLPSQSSSEVESQLQQISAEKPFSPTSKTAEDTTLDPSTIPNLLSLALSPPSPPQPPVLQITQTTLSQIQQIFTQPFPLRQSQPCLDLQAAYYSVQVASVLVTFSLPLLDVPVIPTPDLVNRLIHRQNAKKTSQQTLDPSYLCCRMDTHPLPLVIFPSN